MFAFSAVRLYDAQHKLLARPPLDKQHAGYKLLRDFVERRADVQRLFGEDALDGLLLLGGGLFRETARVISEAAFLAQRRKAERIETQDVQGVESEVLKDYQPLLRGSAIAVLDAVLRSRSGWVEGVEPYLQSRAVVEYENGELWLDVRPVLKDYVRSLAPTAPGKGGV